jgi:NAD(P)H dehydrogenase (quinone)
MAPAEGELEVATVGVVAGWDMVAAADGIVFGRRTLMGGPSWQIKRFADTAICAWRSTLWRD